jgi:chromosomal replication initiation ATPase DnaA
MTQALRGDCRYCGSVTDPQVDAIRIVQEVAEQHRVPVPDVYSRRRAAYIVATRACAIRRLRAETKLTITAIGNLFGLDHSTVIHHLSKNGAKEAAAAAIP